MMSSLAAGDAEPLFAGIDGGGTKCRARIFSFDNRLLGTGLGGPANPYHGEAQAQASIVQAVNMALLDANLPLAAASHLIAGVGLAGVNLPSVFNAMNAWAHPFKKMYLCTDLHIACLAAHEGADGAVIIAGTGSCGYSFVKGRPHIIGGHGFPCGDQGSGAWLGLEAMKAVLLACDALGPQTQLRDLLGDYWQASGALMVDKLGAAKPSDYAQLARFVIAAADAKDEVATNIMRAGADYLSALAEQLWATGASRMAFIGGVSAALTPWLAPSVAARLSAPIHQPEFGALYFARQQYALASA